MTRLTTKRHALDGGLEPDRAKLGRCISLSDGKGDESRRLSENRLGLERADEQG